MEIILMNMCMIYNPKNSKVLVLDKIKKHGWEGLTFPGGHVEPGESFETSCIREIKEETNLDIRNPQLKGFIQWYVTHPIPQRHVGILYYTEEFSGEVDFDSNEGRLSWMDLEAFIAMENKSDSMDDCMRIYMGENREVVSYFVEDKMIRTEYF